MPVSQPEAKSWVRRPKAVRNLERLTAVAQTPEGSFLNTRSFNLEWLSPSYTCFNRELYDAHVDFHSTTHASSSG